MVCTVSILKTDMNTKIMIKIPHQYLNKKKNDLSIPMKKN